MQINYWPSPAKLNIFLHLVGRRTDGYHQLQTVFQLLNFCDQLIFSPRHDQQINCTFTSVLDNISSINTVIPEETNLVIKAARLLRAKTKTYSGIDIRIEKRIPIGGGLGGGSSNAATTLLALNYLWQLNLSFEELHNLALSLGADVPLFIKGYSSWAEGIGDQLQAITLPEAWYLVLVPSQIISTKKIFSYPQLTYDTPSITIQTFLSGCSNIRNDFETIVRKNFREIDEAFNFLNHFAPARLSGTGSCVFAALETKKQAVSLQKKIEFRYHSFVSKGLSVSPLREKLDAL